MTDHDLTPQEREAFAALPRERQASPALEERTVRALRAQGILQAEDRRTWRVTPVRLGLAAALALACLTGAFALGQWAGARQTAGAMLALQEQNGSQVATAVQRTGSAYVTALAALVHLAGTPNGTNTDQGREVALSALHAAADQIIRLDPDDPLAARILQAFDEAQVQEGVQAASPDRQDLYWF
jgi:hypothetical protein